MRHESLVCDLQRHSFELASLGSIDVLGHHVFLPPDTTYFFGSILMPKYLINKNLSKLIANEIHMLYSHNECVV